jgi:glycerol-3-phosphate dehydrogenase
MTLEDVSESFAGLRVLPREEGSIFSRNRDTILLTDSTDNPRVLSIYGGKLTAYRATAEKVLEKISRSLPSSPGNKSTSVMTRDLPLS